MGKETKLERHIVTLRENGSRRIQKVGHLPSKTKQADLHSSNINTIMKRFSGNVFEIPHVPLVYGEGGVDAPDLIRPVDYQEAQNIVVAGREAFDRLPSRIRERFENDPSRYLDFLADPESYDEGVRLGIFEKRKDPVAPAAPADAAPAPSPDMPKGK